MTENAAVQNNPSSFAVESLSVIKFGPGNVLFVGDSKSATLLAFELGDVQPAEKAQFYNVKGIELAIAELLGAQVSDIAIKDLAVHPVSQEAYIAVHRGHGDAMIPIIVKVNAKRQLADIELARLPHTQVKLRNPIDPQVQLRNHISARSFTITGLAFHGGEVFVSGLSNAEFSSTVYRIPYPFAETITQSSIEMYHTMHGQNETRAPIQAMAILPLGDKPHLLAAYTCTPLVTIPVDALADGAHVRAKTIGELGYGNTPLAILPFQARDRSGQVQEKVLITSKNRGPMLFNVSALAESNDKEGLSTGVGMNVVAPANMAVPLAGLYHVADQDATCLLGLRRDLETGRLDLLSFEKGLYFRVTDFVSEYAMPSYVYQDSHLSQWQQMKLVQEGVE